MHGTVNNAGSSYSTYYPAVLLCLAKLHISLAAFVATSFIFVRFVNQVFLFLDGSFILIIAISMGFSVWANG